MFRFVSAFQSIPRILWAMLLSTLVHAGIMAFPLRTPAHVEYVVYARGLPSLEVRIARISEDKTGTRDIYLRKNSPSWKGPSEKTLKPARKSESAQTKEKENTSPVNSEEASDRPLPAGVSLSQTLFPGPLPPFFSESSGEYVKEADLDETPAAIRIAVPQYPPQALENAVGGWILVALLLDENGAVISTAAIKSSEQLTEYRNSVAETILHSAFSPGKRNGKPVRTMIFQTVNFDPKAYANAQSEAAGSKSKPDAATKRSVHSN